MSESNQEVEAVIIPKGTMIKIHGIPFWVKGDTSAIGLQSNLEYALKKQQEWLDQPKSSLVSSNKP